MEEQARGAPVISIDYIDPSSKESKRKGIESLPILSLKGRKSTWCAAYMVPRSGIDGYAVGSMVRAIELS